MDEARRHAFWKRLDAGDPRGAVLILTKGAARGDDQDPEVSYLLGRAHFRAREFVLAEGYLARCTSIDPMNADAFYYLGLCAERQGLNESAVKSYSMAASLNPGLREARQKLRLLDAHSERYRDPHPAPARQPTPVPKDSAWVLPKTDEEFADFEERTARRELITQRAKYSAQMTGLPWWAKLLMAIIAILIVIVFLSILYDAHKNGLLNG